MCRRRSIQQVGHQPVGQLGFEPVGFRWHDFAGVGDRHQVGHLGRVQCEGSGHVAAVDAPLQFPQPTNATNEVDALVAAQVLDAEHRAEQVVGEQADVESRVRDFGVILVRACG